MSFLWGGVFFPGLLFRRDYATWTNMQDNISSTAMSCDYKMVGRFWRCCYVVLIVKVDTEFFLPILMRRYFVDNHVGHSRFPAFLKYVLSLV